MLNKSIVVADIIIHERNKKRRFKSSLLWQKMVILLQKTRSEIVTIMGMDVFRILQGQLFGTKNLRIMDIALLNITWVIAIIMGKEQNQITN